MIKTRLKSLNHRTIFFPFELSIFGFVSKFAVSYFEFLTIEKLQYKTLMG
jgi:hypothetical protein